MGHRKFIKPNKRAILPLFDDVSVSDEESGRVVRDIHRRSQGQPEPRAYRRDRDVVAYPVPECMCKPTARFF